MLNRIRIFVAGVCLLLPALLVAQPSAEPAKLQDMTFGVLAFRPKAVTTAQWQPLVEHLNQSLPGIRVSLRVLNFPEMEQAVAKREVDVVLTNSAHYVLMNYRDGLTSPIATLVSDESGLALHTFGGVVVSLAARDDLRSLADLQDKRIATPSIQSFGGYLMVAYEMQQAGVPLPTRDRLLETGMPHDKAIEAVLAGAVDAAFVRTSVYEGMKAEGKIHEGQLRIINRQLNPAFPLALSTRLYPEWPVAVLPHVDGVLAAKFAAALLLLPHEGEVARKVGIHGFNIPTNHQLVVDLLRALRQPPFDAAPSFDVRDIWHKYDGTIIASGVLGALILLLLLLLWRKNALLRELSRRAEAGDMRLRQFSQQLPGVLYEYHLRPDGTSHYPYVSEKASEIFGVNADALNESAENLFARLHPDDLDAYKERVRHSAETMQSWRGEYRLIMPDGSVHWRECNALPQRQEGGGILWYGFADNIDERKVVEARAELLVAALEASANAVIITDLSGTIEWVNPAFCALTGYTREELVGANPRLLKSGLHDAAFYADMWQQINAGQPWRGEIINLKKDGSLGTEELIIAPVRDAQGKTHHYIGIKQDIAEQKRMVEELQKQAKTDMLTGLANRRCFFSRAEGELARIKRGKAGIAVLIMLDIDHFKRVNDTYGHATGDRVLVHLADTLRGNLRRSDVAGRLGGEEFALLLPETTVEQAYQFAERLRVTLASLPVATEAGEVHYTVSFGLTMMGNADPTVDAALVRADEALYCAKNGGRNRVEFV